MARKRNLKACVLRSEKNYKIIDKIIVSLVQPADDLRLRAIHRGAFSNDQFSMLSQLPKYLRQRGSSLSKDVEFCIPTARIDRKERA